MFDVFSLTNPLALGLVALAPSLVLAYLRKQKKAASTVPSIFLLKKLSKKKIVRKKFKPPLNFWFELLALLLLGLAACLPLLSEKEENVAILFDTSQSMKADNTLGEAKDKLREWFSIQPSSRKYYIYTSAPKLTRLNENPINKSSAIRISENIEAISSSHSYEGNVIELASDDNIAELVLVTDKAISKGDSISENTRVSILSTSAKKANIAIRALTKEGNSLRADISLYAPLAQKVDVSFFEHKTLGTKERFLGKKTIRVDPLQTTSAKFKLNSSRAVGYSVKIETPDNTQNALLEDDTAFISAQVSAKNKIALIGSNKSYLGLRSIPRLSVELLSLESFEKLSEARIKDYTLLIFYKTAPSSAPKTSSLLVLPPDRNQLFSASAPIDDPKISSWSEHHSILTYLKVPLLKISQAKLFDVPLWAESIVNSQKGSLLIAGESEKIRFAATGFEIFPFESRRTPTLSVLTLNLFNWLQKTGFTPSAKTHSSKKLEGPATWVTSYKKEVQTLDVEENSPYIYDFKKSGLYSFTSVKGNTKETITKNTEIIAVNSIFPEESDTFTSPEIELPLNIPKKESEKTNSLPLWPLLCLAALAFLVIEYLIRIKTNRLEARKS